MYTHDSSDKTIWAIDTSNSDEDLLFQATFKKIADLGNAKFDFNNYNYIPTIAYRDEIEKYINSLKTKCGYDKFAILIIYNNVWYWLSNTYNDLAIPHDIFKLSQLDLASVGALNTDKDHFFPTYEFTTPVYELFTDIVQKFYHFHIIYSLIRCSSECRIMLALGNSQSIGDLSEHEKIYQKTYKAFENFCADFLDDCMNFFTLTSNQIRLARIFYDANHRRMLITGKYSEHTDKLTEKELICLHWASLGKTAEEVGTILNISQHTVRQHLKDVINKLQATNITHAVYKAKCLNII